MGDIKLNANDFMAITRAMDINKNNRLDPAEATVSRSANMMIGNANGVAGTRETASSLQQGEVFISRFNRDAANNIAIYFSDRGTNEGKQVKDWTADNFISKEDLPMSDSLRNRIDINGDNRISRSEFSDALVEGMITIGGNDAPPAAPAPSNSNDPFSRPSSQTGNSGSDPFSRPAAKPSNNTSDPFSRPAAKPPASNNSNDPFAAPRNKQAAKPSSDPFSNPFGR